MYKLLHEFAERILWRLLLTNRTAYAKSSDSAVSILANQDMNILIQGDIRPLWCILDGRVRDFESPVWVIDKRKPITKKSKKQLWTDLKQDRSGIISIRNSLCLIDDYVEPTGVVWSVSLKIVN